MKKLSFTILLACFFLSIATNLSAENTLQDSNSVNTPEPIFALSYTDTYLIKLDTRNGRMATISSLGEEQLNTKRLCDQDKEYIGRFTITLSDNFKYLLDRQTGRVWLIKMFAGEIREITTFLKETE